ncbi:hypothetical protein ACLMJK_006062 [Lecanora helva]
MSDLDCLIKPQHILQLISIPDASKVKHFTTVTDLWLKIQTQPPDSREHQYAYKKLLLVSDVVRAAVAHPRVNTAGKESDGTK